MQEFTQTNNHSISIQNRQSVEMTGIKDVSSFNEEEINASCECGEVLIKGSNLLVEALDLDNGILKISGRVTAVVYSEKSASNKLFKKLFS